MNKSEDKVFDEEHFFELKEDFVEVREDLKEIKTENLVLRTKLEFENEISLWKFHSSDLKTRFSNLNNDVQIAFDKILNEINFLRRSKSKFFFKFK